MKTKFYEKSDINELDNLLNDLDFAKKNFDKLNNNSKTRRSLEKLIDSLDSDQIVVKNYIYFFSDSLLYYKNYFVFTRTDNIEPKASEATKELENLMNSLSAFQVDSNENSQSYSSSTNSAPRSATRTPIINNICEGCGTAISGQVSEIFIQV